MISLNFNKNSIFVNSITLRNSSTLGNAMRLEKNTFNSCYSKNSCSECEMEDYYKKCDRMCYCCNSEDKCFTQNK